MPEENNMTDNQSGQKEEVYHIETDSESQPPEVYKSSGGGSKKKIVWIVIALIIAAAVIFFAVRGFGSNEEMAEEEEIVSEEGQTDTSQFPDYTLSLNMNKVDLVSNFISWTPNSQLDNSKIKNLQLKQTGELSKAYLYVRASTEEKPLSKFESFYFKLAGQGGHLFRPNSLALPESDKTELLYALENVSYLPSIPYDETRSPSEINLFSLFGDDKNINIYTFISSRKAANIEELSIYYDCVEDSECLLSL